MNGADWTQRYQDSLLGVFGTPQLVLDHGQGAYVWDVDGRRYLDLVGGIAVSVLGHNHPDLVAAVSKQAGELLHVSNFFTSRPQIELAEALLRISGAPAGSRAFFVNSGAEAIEAAIKLARRTGRTGLVAAEGAFHGRTTGALALTAKAAYREPFLPLLGDVTHIPYGDVDALAAAIGPDTSAVFLEPILGEGGVVPASDGYLLAARELTTRAGALLVVDEIQTGMGRTGDWFGYHQAQIVPDAITVAKGLGGGVPIGALIVFGETNASRLLPGQHGTTFGGNPLACAAGLAVIDAIERLGLLEHVTLAAAHFGAAIDALDHPGITGHRGRGLLQAVLLRDEIAPAVAAAAREAGFLVNPVAPSVLRIAPAYVVTTEQLDSFVTALPAFVDQVTAQEA